MNKAYLNINDFGKLYNHLRDCTNVHYAYDSATVRFVDTEKILVRALQSWNIDFDEHNNNEYGIPLNSFNGQLFWNNEHFIKKAYTDNWNFEESKNIGILNTDMGISYFYDTDKNETYIDFNVNKNNYFFENIKGLKSFFRSLEDKSKDTGEVFQFVDYFSKDFGKIIFIGSKDFSRITIKYEMSEIKLDDKTDYKKIFNDFEDCFSPQSKHLPKFLKNSIISFIKNETEKDRIQALINKLPEILRTAELNFEVYLNELSIEKLKKDYDEYKEKYFSDLASILGKITNKILALPIGISALLFAVSKVENHTFGLLIIAASILVSMYYISSVIGFDRSDIIFLRNTLNKNYENLKESSFFGKFPDELVEFDIIKKRVDKRINNLLDLTNSFFWILNLANSIILGYVISFWTDSIFLIIISCFIILGILVFLREYFLNED
jgi:hypothetical protein